MIPTRDSLPTELSILRGLAEIARAMKFNLAQAEAKIVAGTINSSDILDGLWDKENALPKWLEGLAKIDAVLRTPTFNKLARDVTGDPTLEAGNDLDALVIVCNQLVSDIRGHITLFNPDGSERNTINDVDGRRRSTIYAAGELNDLLPPIRACLTHFA